MIPQRRLHNSFGVKYIVYRLRSQEQFFTNLYILSYSSILSSYMTLKIIYFYFFIEKVDECYRSRKAVLVFERWVGETFLNGSPSAYDGLVAENRGGVRA